MQPMRQVGGARPRVDACHDMVEVMDRARSLQSDVYQFPCRI